MVDRLEKKGRRKPPTLLKEADRLCGAIVRSRGRCEACGSTEYLQWAHGFSRSYRKIRHDLRNGFCLCRRCHMNWTVHPLQFDDWLRATWGPDLYSVMRNLALNGPRSDLKRDVQLLRWEYARLGLDRG